MKNIKLLIIGLAAVLGFSACSESWLDNELTGNTMSQEDFDRLDDTNEGMVRGLYSFMYAYGGDHQTFGQKSIDIATDLLSCDMVMSANAYGWFVQDATLTAATSSHSRNSYIWSYYYQIIMNANRVILSYSNQPVLTQVDQSLYAQALTMRAYCYFNLLHLYTPGGKSDLENVSYGGSLLDYRAVPIYTESHYNAQGLVEEQNLSTKREIIARIHDDLGTAIAFFDGLSPDSVSERASKLYVNADIARTFQAYTFLTEAMSPDQQDAALLYDTAYKVAQEVIDAGNYDILPYEDVLTTGFVDVNDNSWMWGLDVTAENVLGLPSFWGHMDIHTYSYASAGAYKVIDKALYDELATHKTDRRLEWFEPKQLYPDYKFYDLARGTGNNVDRRWLNDVVFMRVEEVYLLAAEALYRGGKDAEAAAKLSELVEQRDPERAKEVVNMTGSALEEELYFNWRIELWGEGRGLMTFKRFGISKPKSTNSFYKYKEDMLDPNNVMFTFQLPYSEYSGNSAISK